MPTLFGSEYLLPAIIVVVLLLTLLLLMSARRRASAGALPKKQKSKRKNKAPVVVSPAETAVAQATPDPAPAPIIASVVTEPAVVEPSASPVRADVPPSPVAASATAETVALGEVAALAAVTPAEAAEVADEDAHLSRFELRRRSPRRGARITVRTQAAGAGIVRPDPLQAALADIQLRLPLVHGRQWASP
jgi:hypothetical protein